MPARAFEAERMAVLFPSGRLAKRRWWSLHERPWMASGAMMARRFNLPVVPLHITARNSALFYLFDRIHPTLRDITLFHEVLNKARQRYRLNLGPAIEPETLPANSAEAIEVLRARTLELGGRKPQTVLTAPVSAWRAETGAADGLSAGFARETPAILLQYKGFTSVNFGQPLLDGLA